MFQRDDGQLLVTRRADDRSWCFPAGAAEVGGSFARTGIDELAEETGIVVAKEDLIPFASLSEAEEHTINYPNGDVTVCSRSASSRRGGGAIPAPTATSRPR